MRVYEEGTFIVEIPWDEEQKVKEFWELLRSELKRAEEEKNSRVCSDLEQLLLLLDNFYAWRKGDHSEGREAEIYFADAYEEPGHFRLVIEDPLTLEIRNWLRKHERR